MLEKDEEVTSFECNVCLEGVSDNMYSSDADVVAVVESWDGEEARLTERNKFFRGDTLELLNREGKPVRFVCGDLRDGEGNPIDCANHPMMPLRMRLPAPAERLSIIRKIKARESR